MRKLTVLVGMAALALSFGLSKEASALTCAEADAGSSAVVHICAEPKQGASGWNLLVRSDVPIAAAAVGIVNATSFMANTDFSIPSCFFVPCGTQGPNASGDGVVANAIYFQWAAGGVPPNLITYGNSPDMQLLGMFEANGAPSLTLGGTNSLFGTNEDFPVLDANDIGGSGVPLGDVLLTVVPEPSTYALAGLGLLGLFGMRLRRR